MKNYLLCFWGLIALVLVACDVEDPTPEEQSVIDRDLILEYLANNNIDATEHESGIFYKIDAPGSIAHPEPSSTVTIKYSSILKLNNWLDN